TNRTDMKSRLLWMLLVTVASSFAQPKISDGGVLNSASYVGAGFANSGIAQGSLFLVFGSGLGPAAIQSTGFPLPKQLGGTSMKVTVNGTTVDALMVYSLASQLAAVLPSSTPTGTGTITVT